MSESTPGEDRPQASEETRTAAEQEDQTGAETSADPTEDSEGSEDSGDSEDSGAGEGRKTRQPGADPEDTEEIEQDREERLDPENRPENAEVDNSDRQFDPEKGMFTDSEGYEEAEEKFPPIGEQGA